MKHVTKRHHFHAGVHVSGTLCQMWDDGLGLIRRLMSGTGTKLENVRLKAGDWVMYLGDDESDPTGRTYIRCMSKHGICWVFPNVVTVIVAATRESGRLTEFTELNSIPTIPRFERSPTG